jgi:hypothetical protein
MEAQFTEDSGLVPHTPKWLAHWTDWFNRRIRGEDPPGRIPIDALRILMQADNREASVSTQRRGRRRKPETQ